MNNYGYDMVGETQMISRENAGGGSHNVENLAAALEASTTIGATESREWFYGLTGKPQGLAVLTERVENRANLREFVEIKLAESQAAIAKAIAKADEQEQLRIAAEAKASVEAFKAEVAREIALKEARLRGIAEAKAHSERECRAVAEAKAAEEEQLRFECESDIRRAFKRAIEEKARMRKSGSVPVPSTVETPVDSGVWIVKDATSQEPAEMKAQKEKLAAAKAKTEGASNLRSWLEAKAAETARVEKIKKLKVS